MFFVGLENFSMAVVMCLEQSGFFKAVELQAYSIGTVAKFSFETTQVAGAGSVEEELQHEFDAGAGSDEGVEHLGDG